MAGDEPGARGADPVAPAGAPGEGRPAGRWRLWRPWLSLLAKPARRVVLVFILLLVIEYLVVPSWWGPARTCTCSGG